MRVKMLVDIAGHWADAEGHLREWAAHNHEMDVPEEVGRELVRLGHAIEVVVPALVESAVLTVEAVVTPPAPPVEPPPPVVEPAQEPQA